MLKDSLCVFAWLFCAMGAAYGVNPAREIEPNDTMVTATAITIAEGEFRGQLSSATDKDFFAFASPGGVVNFMIRVENRSSFSSERFTVSILSGNGAVLTSRDMFEVDTPVTISANTIAGNYYLLFRAVTNSFDVVSKDYIVNSSWDVKKPPACPLDIDGDGKVDALTDGLMLLRILFGLTGAQVTNNAVSASATRPTWADIRAFLNANCGTNLAP